MLWACGNAVIAWLRQTDRLSKTNTTSRTRYPTKELSPLQVVTGQRTIVESKRPGGLWKYLRVGCACFPRERVHGEFYRAQSGLTITSITRRRVRAGAEHRGGSGPAPNPPQDSPANGAARRSSSIPNRGPLAVSCLLFR